MSAVAGANDPALTLTGGTATQSYGKINMTGAGTGVDIIRIANDGGTTLMGTERNSTGGLAGGSIAYASMFGSIGAQATQIMSNNTARLTILSNGRQAYNGSSTRLKQLKPARFNWIADETNALQDGFLAHEVSSVVPEAITGEKDAEEMQQIDQSKLVPLLVKTIQELEARITVLEGS